MRLRFPAVSLILVFTATFATACGAKKDGDPATDSAASADSAPAVAATPASSASPTSTSDAPLTVADIDRWQRGMNAELEAVQRAATQLKDAKNSNDSLNALFAATESSTRAAGAKGAGVDEQRYRAISSTLSSVVGNMAPLEQEMDVSKMPPAAVATLKQAREQGLASVIGSVPPDVASALHPRAAELRKQELTLVAERLKVAQMAR